MTDTIAAIATPSGRGGVGIVRVSGPQVKNIATKILDHIPSARMATFTAFFDKNNVTIDIGIALFFSAPNSYTGEDVLELQGHGGPVIMDMLLARVLECGARLAGPGEFTERAFLNDKIDLSQAEAIADLIDCASQQAARSAVRSLQGRLSVNIKQLVADLTNLRVYVEAAIDFPTEEIDFLADSKLLQQAEAVITAIKKLLSQAQQGSILREGLTIVIAGKPNAGKSTLLNQLSGRESAIVTDIPGTTRDVMREYISIDGIPLHIIDTAGLRESTDIVEQEGIKRAWQAIENADQVLLVVDHADADLPDCKNIINKFKQDFSKRDINIPAITVIVNKIDNTELEANIDQTAEQAIIYLSAKQGTGLDLLQNHLKSIVGFSSQVEGSFLARRRHVDALEAALLHTERGLQQLTEFQAGELFAEELRLAQQYLASITGEFTADDLLGEIFSSFCIGK